MVTDTGCCYNDRNDYNQTCCFECVCLLDPLNSSRESYAFGSMNLNNQYSFKGCLEIVDYEETVVEGQDATVFLTYSPVNN